jgi:hypothetical protein
MSALHVAASAAAVVAVAASASPAAAAATTSTLRDRQLTVVGGPGDNRIAVRARPGTPAVLEVDVGDDGRANRRFKLAKVDEVVVIGRGGADRLRIDRAAPLPAALPVTLSGGGGNELLTGADGAERLEGGDGQDLADGGRGADLMALGAGDDTAVWNPGDGSDTIAGDGGRDVMAFNGAGAAERMDLTADGPVLRLFRNVGTITMLSTGVEVVEVAAAAGADHVGVGDLTGTGVTDVDVDLAATPAGSQTDGAADEVVLTGTPGDDAIDLIGTTGLVAATGLPAHVRIARADAGDSLVVDSAGGADTIDGVSLAAGLMTLTEDGGTGADTMLGSQGDDTAIWNPGDGSDTIDGQAGGDVMVFNGANGGEGIEISSVGERVRFFRDVGNITMSLGSVEGIDFAALGGPDTVRVGDLSGTPMRKVVADLAAGAGGPDLVADTVTVAGTLGVDAITVAGAGALVRTTGLPAIVDVAHPDGALDRLRFDTLVGDDSLDSSGLAPGTIVLEVVQ